MAAATTKDKPEPKKRGFQAAKAKRLKIFGLKFFILICTMCENLS